MRLVFVLGFIASPAHAGITGDINATVTVGTWEVNTRSHNFGTLGFDGGIGGFVAPEVVVGLRAGLSHALQESERDEKITLGSVGPYVDLWAKRDTFLRLSVNVSAATQLGFDPDEEERGYGFEAGLGFALGTGTSRVVLMVGAQLTAFPEERPPLSSEPPPDYSTRKAFTARIGGVVR
jgi:hypothetical protein